MLEIRGIWLCHMSRWDRYVLRPRIWMETSRSGTVPHIGPYTYQQEFLAPLPGAPGAKIGELHTPLYLCFFSLVSLPFSFYLCVFYQKLQKKNLPHLLPLWVPLKTPSCVTSLVKTTKTLSALPLPPLPLQLPLMKLNLLC